MGVPAFFRWLSRKYPSVIVYSVEEKPKEVGGIKIPVESDKPNPNGVEFDNLYLDMNGIIHPCTHPEDKPAPKDEDEMMVAIFECIDRLFSIVRPRKLLYMAIDGVAPRAKMNQQRSRRFRASKETAEKIDEISNLRKNLLEKGAFLPPEKPKESHFDSNCITPGTPFMARLSACLHYYIHERLNNDPGWKCIKVILSDANVPGEGEHKIMDYIRRQRAQPDHDPNTQHCLCGADADLIMLGLATHEPNFTIIREEFRPNKPRPCDLCHQIGHEMKDCVGCPKALDGAIDLPSFGDEVPFIFVRLCVLREYLERELTMPNLPFKYDFERAIDDWVFMCFFVGNDFLPHLPSLEIREGAIDRLVGLYKDCVYKTGGFITDSGDVNLSRVQLILSELGKAEDEIFKKRQQTEQMFKQREKRKKKMAREARDGDPVLLSTPVLWSHKARRSTHRCEKLVVDETADCMEHLTLRKPASRPSWTPRGQYAPTPLGHGALPNPIANPRQEAYQGRIQAMHTQADQASLPPVGQKRKMDGESESEEETPDEVRLWEDGFKDRYYESKFDVEKDNVGFRVKVGLEYVRGLCWVLRYYYQGCASWKWYFPYHYAPFASDFLNISSLSTEFELDTKPFRPLEQLMGVFPAASSSHVPKPWAKLMHDPFSHIIDFYPIDFKIDLNGKKFAWQGVALLPFVEEKRLFKALEPLYADLTPAEKRRNMLGDDRLYLSTSTTGYNFLKGLYENQKGPVSYEELTDWGYDGMQGKVLLSNDVVEQGGLLQSPVKGLASVSENVVLCCRFRDPKYAVDFIFKAIRLKGAKEPARVLKPGDLSHEQNRNWRPQTGLVPSDHRANVSVAGHRMLNHYNDRSQQHNQRDGGNYGGVYSSVPPPSVMPLMPQFQGRGYSSASSNRYGNSNWQSGSDSGGRSRNQQQWNDNRGNNNRGNYSSNRDYNNSNRDFNNPNRDFNNPNRNFNNPNRDFNNPNRNFNDPNRGPDRNYNTSRGRDGGGGYRR